MILVDYNERTFEIDGTGEDLLIELLTIVKYFSKEILKTDGEKERLINTISIIINEGLNDETKEKINEFNKEHMLKETKSNLGIRSIE